MRRLLLVVVVLAAGGCDAQGDRPGMVVIPGMHYSLPYDAFGRNDVTGQTLLLPPEGSIPYGTMPFTFGPGKEEAARAAVELHSPLSGDPKAQLPRGKKVFDIFCGVCHGPAGVGDGPIIGRFPNPANLLADHARELADGQIYHIIYHGQGLMPGYAVQVQDADRWRLVAYVRWLQQTALAQAAAPPADPAAPGDSAAPGETP